MCDNVIYCIYYIKDLVSFQNNFESVPKSRVGVSVSETIDYAPIFDPNNNKNLG